MILDGFNPKHRDLASVIHAALPCPVFILKRHQCRLERTQHKQRQAQAQRQPEQSVQPHGRPVSDLDQERRPGDDEAGDQDDENGGTVTGLGEFEIEAAMGGNST